MTTGTVTIDLEGWKHHDDLCPECGEPFGWWKQFKRANGEIIHRNCATDEDEGYF